MEAMGILTFFILFGVPAVAIIMTVCLFVHCEHDYKKVEYMGKGGTTKNVLVCSKCGKIKYLRG